MAKRLIEYFVLLLNILNVISWDAPNGIKVSFLEPSGVYVEWDEVPFGERRNIEGFKIKLWTVKEETTRHFKLLNGEQYPGLERNDYAKELFTEKLAESDNGETTLNSPGNFVRIKNLSFDKLYEIRVLPYKGDKVGPMSEPRRFKLVRNDNFVLLAERSLDGCSASVITNKTDEPFVYNTVL